MPIHRIDIIPLISNDISGNSTNIDLYYFLNILNCATVPFSSSILDVMYLEYVVTTSEKLKIVKTMVIKDIVNRICLLFFIIVTSFILNILELLIERIRN